jgi:hypothetical protein
VIDKLSKVPVETFSISNENCCTLSADDLGTEMSDIIRMIFQRVLANTVSMVDMQNLLILPDNFIILKNFDPL